MRNAFDGLDGLISPASIGQGVQKAFEAGQVRGALARFGRDPNNPATLNALIAVAPEIGFKAADYQREQAKTQQEQDFRGALSEYVTTGGGNALLASPGRQPLPRTPGALEGRAGGMTAGQSLNALQTPAVGQTIGPARPPAPDQAPESMFLEDDKGPDLSALGTPKNGRDAAFLRMLKADPLKAIKIDSEMRDNFVSRLKDEGEMYALAADRLSMVQDEAGYQRTLAELSPMVAAVGGNLADHVPATYPGPDGLRELATKALSAKERISTFMQQANIDDDNERADRNTDSLIEDRDERRGETRRYHDAQSGNTRRGQDIRSGDTRRGQDRPRAGGRAGSSYARPVSVKSPEEAKKLPKGTHIRTPDGRVMVVR